MLIKYLVYVNGSNQRTTPKEITTWFPFSDISPNHETIPKIQNDGLEWQGTYQHQTEEEAHQGNMLIWNRQGNFQLMQPQLLFFRMISDVHLLWRGHHKERLQDVFGGSHANCSKSMYFLKLRFNKPTVCFLRRREVFYSVSGGSLIPALRSCSSIDLAHDPTCISRFEYIIYIYNLHNIYLQKHYMYPKISGLFG